jgi:hypothetical protein
VFDLHALAGGQKADAGSVEGLEVRTFDDAMQRDVAQIMALVESYDS